MLQLQIVQLMSERSGMRRGTKGLLLRAGAAAAGSPWIKQLLEVATEVQGSKARIDFFPELNAEPHHKGWSPERRQLAH